MLTLKLDIAGLDLRYCRKRIDHKLLPYSCTNIKVQRRCYAAPYEPSLRPMLHYCMSQRLACRQDWGTILSYYDSSLHRHHRLYSLC
jgi:hypothetical protein